MLLNLYRHHCATALIFAGSATFTWAAVPDRIAGHPKGDVHATGSAAPGPMLEAHGPVLPAGRSGGVSTLRQGGDTCASATPLADPLPILITGTTSGYTDDYDESCPGFAPGSPDVVYVYTPTADVTVEISICNSAYDTKLYVYEGSCPGTLIACDDDSCGSDGWKSRVSWVSLQASTTYYIIVDGFGGESGDYELEITEGTSCPQTCEAGYIDENEPDCGAASDGGDGIDTVNGGCWFDPFSLFTPMACGNTYCGTIGADGGYYDADAYFFELTEQTAIVGTLTPELTSWFFSTQPIRPVLILRGSRVGGRSHVKKDVFPGAWTPAPMRST